MDTLRISGLQTALYWEDCQANLAHFTALVDQLEVPSDVILLPEMFASGFSMQPQRIAEPMDGRAVSWMREKAAKHGAVLMGSLAISEEGKFYNRMICAQPDGGITYYDKRHLFSLAGEDHVYTPGAHHLIVQVKGWKIMPLICYDLRFPVWSRNTDGYDLLVYVANWPTPRIDAWSALLKARAIENQAYVVGLNRTGVDENGHTYPGKSAGFDMAGGMLHECGGDQEVMTMTMTQSALGEFRSRFAFLQDRDQFRIA